MRLPVILTLGFLAFPGCDENDENQAVDATANPDAPVDADLDAPADAGLDAFVNSAPVPEAAAVSTYKNTQGTSQIDPNDPDPGDTFSYAVTVEPVHGGAIVSPTGLVTLTPADDFVGADVLTVRVTDQASNHGDVEIAVTVSNRDPSASAGAILTDVATVGSTTVEASDPDVGEVLTFELTGAPSVLGAEASVDSEGLVQYTPRADYVGDDSLEVTVTDASGGFATLEIPVTIEMTPWTFPGPIPDSLCDDGVERVSVVSVYPPEGAVLTYGATVPVEVVLSYSNPGPGDMALTARLSSTAGTLTTAVPPGCGTAELSGNLLAPSTGSYTTLAIAPYGGFSMRYPLQTATNYPELRFDRVSLAPGTPIVEPLFEIGAVLQYDFHTAPSTVDQRWIQLEEITGPWGYYEFGVPSDVNRQFPVRMRGALACGNSRVQFSFNSTEMSDTDLVYPAVPPVLTVGDFLSRYPVTTDTDSTINGYEITNCDASTHAVTLTPSDDWFSVEPTSIVLAAGASSPVTVTFHGALIPTGTEVVGSLTITPDDSGFEPVTIPVSAVGHAFDPSLYTRLGFTDGSTSLDNASRALILPFEFPAEGAGFTELVVNTNGMIGLGTCADPESYHNPSSFFDAIDPTFQGCVIIAPMWTDLGFSNIQIDTEDPVPDVYYRDVTDTSGHYLDLLYWNIHSISFYRSHHVFAVRLYDDGSHTVDYLQTDWFGFETVGWFHSDGSAGELTSPMSIRDGDQISYGPIP